LTEFFLGDISHIATTLKERRESALLRGKLKTRIDNKGRIFLGAKFRQELGDRAFVLYASDFHVLLVSAETFDHIEAHIKQRIDVTTYNGFLKAMDTDTQKFLRSFYSLHTEVEVDEQGRITLPKFLREDVYLQDELVVYSLGWCLEIWNASKAPRVEPIPVAQALGGLSESKSQAGGNGGA